MTDFSLIARPLKKYKFLLILLVIGSFFLFFRLGDRPLYSKDEGRYAEIPREMLELNDFVTPHLNYVKYFEKPPLLYWFTAASFAVLGENESAARFPVALLGLLTIIATFFFGKTVFGEKTGFLSALILLAAPGFFLISRFLVTDGPFTFFLTVSMFLFWAGHTKNDKRYFWLSYLFMGLAVMTKGLIGIALPALIITIYMLAARDFTLLRRNGLALGIPIFLAVTVPWFFLVSLKNPQFFNFFFLQQHFQRYLTAAAGREEPVYFFLIIGALFFLPWTMFVPASVRAFLKNMDPASRKNMLFLNVWWIVVLVFFSLSKSKLPPYILPITPPLAVLVGKTCSDFIMLGDNLRQIKTALVLFAAGIFALIPYVLWEILTSLKTDFDAPIVLPYAIPLISLFFAMALFLIWAVRRMDDRTSLPSRNFRILPFISIAAVFLIGYILIIFASEKIGIAQSAYAIASEINGRGDKDCKVALLDRYEHFSDIGFYLKKRVILVDTDAGELRFGKNIGNNEDYFIDGGRLQELLNGDERVYCITRRKGYKDQLKNRGLDGFKILIELPKGVLLVNKPK